MNRPALRSELLAGGLVKPVSKEVLLFCESVSVTFHLVPCSTSEVRDSYRCRAVFDRKLGQVGHAAPFCKVINVHIQRKTVAQTVNQTVIHDVVHTTVSTYFLAVSSSSLWIGCLYLSIRAFLTSAGTEPCAFSFSWLGTSFEAI